MFTVSAGTIAAPAWAAAPKPWAPKPPPPPKIEAPGGVIISSTTTGAQIEIDGKVVGKVPIDDSIVVLSGQHTLKMTLRGYTEYLDTFEVQAGEEITLEVDLIPYAGIVRVNTTDPGATVKVDGKVEGVTPFDKDIAVGKKSLMVSRPGFYDDTRELEVRAGETYNIDITLKPLPVKPGEDSAFYKKWWFWTIVGVAGAGAATAIALSSGGTAAAPNPSFTLQVP
ncbi:MAG: PEGA domain-containing protein [Myxococcota bacterium]